MGAVPVVIVCEVRGSPPQDSRSAKGVQQTSRRCCASADLHWCKGNAPRRHPAPEGRQNVAPRASVGYTGGKEASPVGATEPGARMAPSVLTPLWGWSSDDPFPRAGARGYILPPLRGWRT